MLSHFREIISFFIIQQLSSYRKQLVNVFQKSLGCFFYGNGCRGAQSIESNGMPDLRWVNMIEALGGSQYRRTYQKWRAFQQQLTAESRQLLLKSSPSQTFNFLATPLVMHMLLLPHNIFALHLPEYLILGKGSLKNRLIFVNCFKTLVFSCIYLDPFN